MTTKRYPKANQSFGKAEINLLTDTLKVVCVDSADYTYSDSHQFLSDIPSGARVATSATGLANKSVDTSGIFDADDMEIASVTGDQFEAVVIYQDTGSAATSRLISYHDGLTVTPDGNNIIIRWSSGSDKIFKI